MKGREFEVEGGKQCGAFEFGEPRGWSGCVLVRVREGMCVHVLVYKGGGGTGCYGGGFWVSCVSDENREAKMKGKREE